MRIPNRSTAALAALLTLPLQALALCTSDRAPAPQAVLERFISADCETCWGDPQTPDAAPGTLALDWVLPGARGDDAPLSAVASGDAAERLRSLRRAPPAGSDAVTSRREGALLPLRVAQGGAFNDYLGASIELKGGGGPWDAWLVLVERLPAGTEGSPVARNLVRNVFRPGWDRAAPAGRRLFESRAIQIHAGAQPDRLRLVALVQDARGRMRAIRQTECAE